MRTYFNHRFTIAEGGWQQREFAQAWWRIYRNDPRWAPPLWSDWRMLLRGDDPHLARMAPTLLMADALPKQTRPRSVQQNDVVTFSTAMFEEPVAAALLLRDPRRRDASAYAALPHFVNHEESIQRFLFKAQELLEPQGVRRLIVPTGPSPHLQTGLLQDHFHQLPPLHTPYAPPYLPELIALTCRPLGRSLLYQVSTDKGGETPVGSARLEPLTPERLSGDLLPLLQAALPSWADFPTPDALEAAFLLRWVGRWPLHGWLATVDGDPVGFVLLQPDAAPLLHRAGGGRNPLWRLWLEWRRRRQLQVNAGRLLFGGVLPDWRRQGIGTQLWQRALQSARERGWATLSIGPLPSTAEGNLFFKARGITPQRTYLLHRYDF